MKPYTYFIKQRDTGLFYYGVKYGKDADPETFWTKYFTSSKKIKMLIEIYGKESFDTQVRKIFDCPVKAKKWEDGVISRIRKWDNCLNITLGGDAIRSHKYRYLKDKDGLNSYQRAGIKLSQTLKDNPDIVSKRTSKMVETKSIIRENGLTISQETGLKISGDLNPSKKMENKKKISDGVKKWIQENPELVELNKEKSKQAMIEQNVHERHSEWMKENNPTRNTIWVNNGKENIRVVYNEIPIGYNKGRLKFKIKRKEKTCPHCNKTGRGPNMTRYHFDNCKEKE